MLSCLRTMMVHRTNDPFKQDFWGRGRKYLCIYTRFFCGVVNWTNWYFKLLFVWGQREILESKSFWLIERSDLKLMLYNAIAVLVFTKVWCSGIGRTNHLERYVFRTSLCIHMPHCTSNNVIIIFYIYIHIYILLPIITKHIVVIGPMILLQIIFGCYWVAQMDIWCVIPTLEPTY